MTSGTQTVSDSALTYRWAGLPWGVVHTKNVAPKGMRHRCWCDSLPLWGLRSSAPPFLLVGAPPQPSVSPTPGSRLGVVGGCRGLSIFSPRLDVGVISGGAEGLAGSLEKACRSCSPLPSDPLDKPLVGQDTFFLEQTKKKGVRVRSRRRAAG